MSYGNTTYSDWANKAYGSNLIPFQWGAGKDPTTSFINMNMKNPSTMYNPMEGIGQDNSLKLGDMFKPALDGNGGSVDWIKDFMANYGDAAKLGVGAAMGIGNIYTSLSQLGLAKDQFKFTKSMAEKNLANQTQAYNSELYNRERSRLGASGYSREEQDRLINDYVERNKLK